VAALLPPISLLIIDFLLGSLIPFELFSTLRNALRAFASLRFSDWIIFKMRAYSASTPNTWMMQETTQVSTAVSPSAFGALPVTELKMFTSTRNRVTSKAIRPGTTSGGTMNEIQLTMTKSPEGR